MKEWINRHKSEIVVGIVVFLITTLLSKIAHLLIATAPAAGKSFFTKLIDLIYYQAGHQSPFGLDSVLFSTLFSFFITYIIITIIKSFRDIQEEINIDKVNKLLCDLEAKDIDDPELRPGIDKARRITDTIKQRHQKKESVNPHKIKVFLVLASVLIAAYALYMFAYEIIPATMREGFELSITEIAPYIEEREEKVLRSKWVSMVSKEDYIEINSYIKDIKLENGLT